MAFDEDNILQDYIARLLTMQDERDEWLEEEDLKTTALELGLSEADLQRIEKTIEAHQQRGLNFIEHASWDEAVNELKQAMALSPLDVSLIHGLARAHLGRWKATGNAEDQEAAERYTRRCIQLDPDHKASYELLQDMKRIPIRATQSGRPTPAKSRLFFFLLLGAVVIISMLLLWLLVSRNGV